MIPLLGTLFYRFISENFADFDTTSNRPGNTVDEKNKRLAAVIKGVAGLDFEDGITSIELQIQDKTAWLSQHQIRESVQFARCPSALAIFAQLSRRPTVRLKTRGSPGR